MSVVCSFEQDVSNPSRKCLRSSDREESTIHIKNMSVYCCEDTAQWEQQWLRCCCQSVAEPRSERSDRNHDHDGRLPRPYKTVDTHSLMADSLKKKGSQCVKRAIWVLIWGFKGTPVQIDRYEYILSLLSFLFSPRPWCRANRTDLSREHCECECKTSTTNEPQTHLIAKSKPDNLMERFSMSSPPPPAPLLWLLTTTPLPRRPSVLSFLALRFLRFFWCHTHSTS